ncbi:MAG: hypothetical protein JOZ41_12560 [Chloroflexi bacterium]|nr:hypothetical protein [Chloroflexota bacterium]
MLPIVALGVVKITKGGATTTANIWVSQDSVKNLGYADPLVPPSTNATAALTQLLQTLSFDLRVAKESPLYWKALVASTPYPNVAVVPDLGRNVKIAANGPNLVSISYSSKLPAVGLQLVQSIVNEIPREIGRLDQQQATSSVALYTRQEKDAQKALVQSGQQLQAYMAQHNISPQQMAAQSLFDPKFAALYQAVQTAQTDLRNAQQQIAQLTSPAALQSTVQVVDPPSAIVAATSKKTLIMYLGIGLIVGLILSGAFVVMTTARDHSLRYADEVPDLLGLPVLTSVPYSQVLARRGSPPAAGTGGAKSA